MRFDVPDSLIEVFMRVEKEMMPKKVIEALKWASEHPEKAKIVAEGLSKLGKYGKSEFINFLIGYDPEYALKAAQDYEARLRERWRLVGKAIAHAKKGGYKLTLPNGVECTIVYNIEDIYSPYHFHFNVTGQTITLAYRKINGWAVEGALEGQPSLCRLEKILYKGKTYSLGAKAAEALLEAIKMNTIPEIVAAVES